MATTTGGTTYVTSTDLVANYPTASLALANRTDVVASGGPVLVKTAGYTITVADILAGNKFLYNSASSGTFTLPTSSLVDGMVVEVAQIGAAALTVSGGTIVGTAVTSSQYQALRFVYVASGTTWYAVAESAPAGLTIVAPTSIANSGGSASASGGAVTFTGVSSISLNGIFSATFVNYRVSIVATSSTLAGLRQRMRLSGTDNSASSYQRKEIYMSNSTTVFGGNETGTENFLGSINTTTTSCFFDIASPFEAVATSLTGQLSVANYFHNFGNNHQVSTAYDGMTIYPTTGTITGIIRVYGYKNS